MLASSAEILSDLINQPGLGMFAWMCLVFFSVALIIFIWALKDGQFSDLEASKFEIFDEDLPMEVKNNG